MLRSISWQNGKVSQGQRASKNSIRFKCTVKEKRSDAKKALHNLLFRSKGYRDFLQNEWHFGEPKREESLVIRKQKDGTEMEVLILENEFSADTTFAYKLEKAGAGEPNLKRLAHIHGDKALAGQTKFKEARIGMMSLLVRKSP